MDSLECTVNFDLLSKRPDSFSEAHTSERYSLPCEAALAFLKQIDSSHFPTGMPKHVVYSYQLTMKSMDKKVVTYNSETSEHPDKTAAKITLFMTNPSLMPKSTKRD